MRERRRERVSRRGRAKWEGRGVPRGERAARIVGKNRPRVLRRVKIIPSPVRLIPRDDARSLWSRGGKRADRAIPRDGRLGRRLRRSPTIGALTRLGPRITGVFPLNPSDPPPTHPHFQRVGKRNKFAGNRRIRMLAPADDARENAPMRCKRCTATPNVAPLRPHSRVARGRRVCAMRETGRGGERSNRGGPGPTSA